MNILKNFRIRDKLIACFALNIVFMVVIGAISYFSVKEIQKNLDDIFEVRLPAVSYLLEAG